MGVLAVLATIVIAILGIIIFLWTQQRHVDSSEKEEVVLTSGPANVYHTQAVSNGNIEGNVTRNLNQRPRLDEIDTPKSCIELFPGELNDHYNSEFRAI